MYATAFTTGDVWMLVIVVVILGSGHLPTRPGMRGEGDVVVGINRA